MEFTIPERQSATLTFETVPGWETAKVRVLLDAPLDVMWYIEESATDNEKTSRKVYELIADNILLSWNLKDSDGNEIPATVEGIGKVPQSFMTALMKGFYLAAQGVPDPLDEPLQNGKLSPEASILVLANQSESLPPSETQN